MRILTLAILCLATSWWLPAAVVVDDDWDDGERTETNLPDESAWYGSSVAGTPTLAATPGALTGLVRLFETNTTSRLWMTHFTPAGAPSELAQVGDTVRATFVFSASGIATTPATSRGLRIGLFNFSEAGAARVSGDGFSTGAGAGAPGANVTGYMLNLNFAQVFTINNPIEIMKRTDATNINLMGTTTAVFTRVGTTGGGVSGTPGFSNDTVYTLVFSAQLLTDSLDLTVTISDTNGWSISHTVTDSTGPVTGFDSWAVRPNSVLDAAETFTFRQFKVELIPFVPRITGIFLNPEQLTLNINWDSLPGKSYQLDGADSVEAPQWDIIGTVTTSGRTGTVTDSSGYFLNQRFYRVEQLP